MDGAAVYSFSVRIAPQMIREFLTKLRLDMDDIDLFVLHQASKIILDTIRKKMGIPEQKFPVYLEDCGNTVSSTIPLVLDHALKTKRLKKGHRTLLASFGVGFSWAAALVDW